MKRPLFVAIATLAFASPSARAEQMWDCTVLTAPPMLPSQVRGNHMFYTADGDDFRTTLKGLDLPNPKIHIPATTIHYRILENNDVGLVAVMTQARIDTDVGPVITVETFILDKVRGTFREAVMANDGQNDLGSGTCQRSQKLSGELGHRVRPPRRRKY